MRRVAAHRPWLHPLAALALVGPLACGGSTSETGTDTDTGTDTGNDTSTDMLPEGCDALVEAGPDARSELVGALLDASDGATICLGEGDFMLDEEVEISGDGITLRGAGQDKTKFVFDPAVQFVGGNAIHITGDNVTVEDFSVIDTPGTDAIRASDVTNVTYRRITVQWTTLRSSANGAYGLYPVGCTRVTISECTVDGAADAGIYVGQSTAILVEDSVALNNVAGIEIENSTGATVRGNHAYDNTGGLLIFNLPTLPVGDGKYTLAYDNILENNNGENFAAGGTVGSVPVGLGAMILAADFNEMRDNTIRGNDSVGIVVISYLDALFDAYDDPNFDIYPEGNWIHDNTFEDNGANPDPIVQAIAAGVTTPVPEVGWDGCVDDAKDNGDGRLDLCLSGNGDAGFFNFAACGGMKEEDIATVTCEHSPLPELPEGY
ncbi:MAG: right-handed parallel beta-helix repeat-containing protein [Myxococcales bacterium]|nr:right-handed parallel beta-helix repeat-containing protein [Myxococcales bacterium]